MASTKPRSLLRIEYEEAAERYLRSLPPQHFMEATPQSKQREIITESLALVHAQRSEVQYFNELLVQYPFGRPTRIHQVVPDTMVFLHHTKLTPRGSYDLPFFRIRPFWMLEYVSKHNKRKDYDDNFHKYENELKIPYYLLFFPDNMELSLYHRRDTKYKAVRPNAAGRLPIRKLELEVAIQDEWVRVWYRGELLPLPGEQLRAMQQLQQSERVAQEQARIARERERAAEERERTALGALAQKDEELERMRAQLAAFESQRPT